MKRRRCLANIVIVFAILTIWIGVSTAADGIEVSASSDNLLSKYEKSDRKFKRSEIGDKIVYFHQRTINGAMVENDFVIYQFDRNTEELLDERVQWRSDLPEDGDRLWAKEEAPPLIAKQNAESVVEGEVQFSQLIIISPESEVFPIGLDSPTPCWVV
ncbi:MAG: hypothetical protein JRF69_12450, partial [Deltaproteobacteria bacterium]|nr:hypothetical protein [Deltaproteobacteria bacterium]